MNNQELEVKVKELLNIENFFDMIIAVQEFEKEYKGSDFYKKTKIPLIQVIKNAKPWYWFQFNNIVSIAQDFLDSLELDNINAMISTLGQTFDKENADLISIAKEMSTLFNRQ